MRSSDPMNAPAATPHRRRWPMAVLTLCAVAAVAAGVGWVAYDGRVSTIVHQAAAVPALPVPGEAGAAEADLPPTARALLDGGNVAFRAGRYEAALAHYRAAAASAPRHAAPWYGVHMAAQRLGRPALADSAMAAVRARAGAAAAWDDSVVRQAHDSGGRDARLPVRRAGR